MREKEELSVFAYTMTHDLRNYLQKITCYTDIVINDNKEEIALHLHKIDENVKQIQKLLTRSLELADSGN